MNEEKMNLVLTDICGRLPYGVITKNCKNNFDVPTYLLPDVKGIKQLIAEYGLKPYLRPMSSMTEEEKETYQMFFNEDGLVNTSIDTYLDWLLEGHFDFRGLIPRGLALEAPENMYNIK